jgi:flagellar basal-body rod protein FlgG
MPPSLLINRVCVLLSCSVLLTGCQQPRQASNGKLPPTGTAHAFLYAQAGGRVEKVLVVPGQSVRAGDALVQVEPSQSQSRSSLPDGESMGNYFTRPFRIGKDMVSSGEQDQVAAAYLLALDVIAQNLANANTTGFKRVRVNFQEVFSDQDQVRDLEPMATAQLIGGLQEGRPAKVVHTARNFSMGVLDSTGQQLDVAIKGAGFFEVMLPDGKTAYTRAGSFEAAADGSLTTADGYPLLCGFQAIPTGTTCVTIGRDGAMSYSTHDGVMSFQIQVCGFPNPMGLEGIGRNLYRSTPVSGPPRFANPGEAGLGELRQGFLERSNVDVVEEVQNLIRLQTAYDAYRTVTQMTRKLKDPNDVTTRATTLTRQ